MIYSMTGYGQATGEFGDKQIQVELKSLNGKATELRLRFPSSYKDKELLMRQRILDRLSRGKIDVTISTLSSEGEEGYDINKKLFAKYYNELNSLKEAHQIDHGDLIQAVMRIPNVVVAKDEVITDEEWTCVQGILDKAITNFLDFRKTEGNAMADDLSKRANNINSLLGSTAEYEKERIETVKKRMRKNLELYFSNESIDENRFEQELIFYIEKLDITEEKVRLAQHCKYFIEVLENSDEVIGKKLGFISQEMGREINTLGAKSQHSELQQIVVNMKDELEKIKEQLANIV